MCYLCPQTRKAKATAKTIDAALAIWKRKDDREKKRVTSTWGWRHDWTKPPRAPFARSQNTATE